ncbi:MAG: hypothetical protein Kow0096_19560 [Thiohalomonadaceae bacterium]
MTAHAEPPSTRLTPAFAAALDKFALATLENEPGAVYALDRDLRLCYFNPAWFRFAEVNRGEPGISTRFPLGTPLAAAISGPLQTFYLASYTQVLQDGTPWQHDYECSSDTVLRRFHQRCYPLANRQAMIIINSLAVEQAHPVAAETHVADEACYRNQHGLIVQCSHCRRIERAAQPGHWDWIPAWAAAQPPHTSHSLCPPCYDYYYRFRRGTLPPPQ